MKLNISIALYVYLRSNSAAELPFKLSKIIWPPHDIYICARFTIRYLQPYLSFVTSGKNVSSRIGWCNLAFLARKDKTFSELEYFDLTGRINFFLLSISIKVNLIRTAHFCIDFSVNGLFSSVNLRTCLIYLHILCKTNIYTNDSVSSSM